MKNLIVALAVLTCFPAIAFAYIDPGLGSYVIQIVIASLLGVLFFFKRYLVMIKDMIVGKLFGKKTEDNDWDK